MEIYFDNAATTKVAPEAIRLSALLMEEIYSNPSSKHSFGGRAEKYLRDARSISAASLKASESEIVFTSGGTESNNLAIIGGALAGRRRGRHVICSAVEHASVYEPMLFLKEMGFELDVVPVDGEGRVSVEKLSQLVRDDTVLVSIMHVNNEIGTVEPVEELAAAIHKKNPQTLFHVDAIQSFGKLRIRPAKAGIDLLSVSGHKIHAPKGTGFLYIRNGVRVKPIIYGGGQQKGMRSGTENVPGYAALGEAIRLAYSEFDDRTEKMLAVKNRLMDRMSVLPGVRINTGRGEGFAPHIVSVSFSGVRAEVLLHALEEKGIYVSSGSACSSNHPGISGTLKAIGLDKRLLDSTLRFSFSELNTAAEADAAAEETGHLLTVLRKFSRC